MGTLDVVKSAQLARKYGIKFAKARHAKTAVELASAVKYTGFPCAIKLVSAELTHKTDVGGIALGVKGREEALSHFKKMSKLRGFEGVLVQQMASGTEIIIGGKRDPQFGPTVLFGLGGIFVEVFKDFSLGVCPLTRTDAKRMVRSVKGYKLLTGFRGAKKADLASVENAILAVAKLMQKESQIQELDLNPLFATEKGVLAVDARVVV
ncbi:MAG: acetate--CoA ligase family protein [Candidatus Diapherotrites archaeon]|nr:acetate--CoA ligase family protein [Candidatus Micrarchaeota archaeon]MBU1939999.1 acetate--CoA ligase family protein [Candidatus Micrarchaeota archaeon]